MAVVVGRCQLRRILKERRMTQTELSIRSGKTKSRISDYANDRYIMSLDTALNIADVLGCSIYDLYEIKTVASGRENE